MKNRVPSRDRKATIQQHEPTAQILSFCSESRKMTRLLPLFALRYEFFNELYHRFLLTPKVIMKCLCLQALAIVYGKCYEEIGPFTDTKYIVGMLDRVSTNCYCKNYYSF